jgi:hypothetical protein
VGNVEEGDCTELLTWVVAVVQGLGEHLQWTHSVHHVHVLMECDQNLEWLVVALRFLRAGKGMRVSIGE